MLARLAFVSLVFGGLAALPFAAPLVDHAQAGGGPDGAFKIDPVHSTVLFKIRHLGASNFYGRFDEANGTITVSAGKPADSKIHFSIPTAKVDTNNADRDKHLRSADFFNAEEFKSIEFDSTKVEAKGKDELEVTGDLSLHGVKKSVTAHVKQIGYAEKTMMGARIGFETTLQIKRSDFGMKMYLDSGALGDDVDLIVSVEATK